MKRFFIVFFALAVVASTARATSYTQALTVTLVQPDPASHDYINKTDCADDIALQIQWALPSSGQQITVDATDGDVFFSTSQTCSSVDKDIKADQTIAANTTSANYPPSGQSLKVSTANLSCSTAQEIDYYFCIKFSITLGNDIYGNPIVWTFEGGAKIRFDLEAPAAPTSISAVGGDGNMRVYWTPGSETDLSYFNVHFEEAGSTTESTGSPSKVTDPTATGTSSPIKGLTNGTQYDVWVTAVDTSGNESVASESYPVTPRPSADFIKVYKNDGGKEGGGFCFVATAAYGSYADAMVLPLRALRDEVLQKSETGRGFVAGYYQYGPRWARAIRGSEVHRGFARVALLPAVAVAWLSTLGLGEWLVLVGAAVVLVLLVRQLLRRRRTLARPSAVGLLLVVLLLQGAPARAADQPVPAPGTPTTQASSTPSFQFQLRFGPYYPSIDSSKGVTGSPFKTVFGSSSPFLFEVGVDYELWHGFGAFTVGATAGFVQFLGKARLVNDDGTISDEASPDTTVFNLVPFRLTVGYHFDVLAEKWGIPLVPYVAGGLDYYIWWVLNGSGDVPSGGSGGIFGFHVGGGIKFLLDFLDEEAAADLQNDVGIINSFFFGEYMASFVDGFGAGNHFDLGDKTFMFGLMLEF